MRSDERQPLAHFYSGASSCLNSALNDGTIPRKSDYTKSMCMNYFTLKGYRLKGKMSLSPIPDQESILFSLTRNVEGVGVVRRRPRLRLCIPAFIRHEI